MIESYLFNSNVFNRIIKLKKTIDTCNNDNIKTCKNSMRKPLSFSSNPFITTNDDEDNYNKHLYNEFKDISKDRGHLDFNSFLNWEEIQVKNISLLLLILRLVFIKQLY